MEKKFFSACKPTHYYTLLLKPQPGALISGGPKLHRLTRLTNKNNLCVEGDRSDCKPQPLTSSNTPF